MDDGRDSHLVPGDLVDDAIAVCEDLANVLVVKLGNYAAHVGELGQASRLGKNDPNDGSSVGFGISGDICRDGFDVIDRARRPDYCMSHLPSFSSACSWVSVPSVRAASSPLRTFSIT